MSNKTNLTGFKFGRWTAIQKAEVPKHIKKKGVFWLCECSCVDKTRKIIGENSLKNGTSNSCGCYQKEVIKKLANERRKYMYVVGQRIKGGDYSHKRDMIITGLFHDKLKKYNYKCNVCGWENGVITEGDLKKGVGCSCCHSLVVAEGINDIPTTAPHIIKFFQGGYEEAKKYTRSSETKIFPICPDCGRVKQRQKSIAQIFKENSIGCNCSDGRSYPEKFMTSVLDQLNIEYEPEYSPEWLRGYKGSSTKAKFDFYIPMNILIIETDGSLGHGKFVYSKTYKTSQESLDKDKWKDNQAEKNGLKVIRIPSDVSTVKYMSNSIMNKLGNIFNLSNIDWNKCNEFAIKNKVKEVCEYYKNNNEITTTELAKLFNISRGTAYRYLKRGTEVGWCTYDAKREKTKIGIRNFSRQTAIYKENYLINTYISSIELVRNSVDDFGIKFSSSGILYAIKNYPHEYKGYTFKYVE